MLTLLSTASPNFSDLKEDQAHEGSVETPSSWWLQLVMNHIINNIPLLWRVSVGVCDVWVLLCLWLKPELPDISNMFFLLFTQANECLDAERLSTGATTTKVTVNRQQAQALLLLRSHVSRESTRDPRQQQQEEIQPSTSTG